jgi:hypothetical protein
MKKNSQWKQETPLDQLQVLLMGASGRVYMAAEEGQSLDVQDLHKRMNEIWDLFEFVKQNPHSW